MIDERQMLYARLKNQFLIDRAPRKAVVSELCGLQAQFANNPKHALRVRSSDFGEPTWNSGCAKIWSFRHTLHLILLDEIGIFLSARGIPKQWEDGWDIGGGRLEYLASFMMGQMRSGALGREELKAKCREAGLGSEELGNVFHGWGGLFYEMNRRGLIAYQPGTAKKFMTCENVAFMDMDDARAILLRRYFKSFGPATVEDCAAFTGYRKREVAGIAQKYGFGLTPVSFNGTEYFHLGDMPGAGEIPKCLFLAGFDQMIMGYKNRSLILDDNFKRGVITVSGIVNPTILLDGRIRAKWKINGGKLIIAPFAKISKKDKNAIRSYGENLFGRDSPGGVRDILFER
jgi:hypothetical protein